MRFLFLFLSLFVIVSISCNSNDSPTDTGDNNDGKVSISGYVFQQANGLIHFVSGAEVKIGNLATSSDSTGRYNLKIDPGYYDIVVAHDSYDSLLLDSIDLTQGRNYDLAIQGPLFSVSGTINHPVYGPIAGAIVRVEHLSDTTDDTGYYFIDSVIQGEWEIEIRSDDYYGFLDTVTFQGSDIVGNYNLALLYYILAGRVSNYLDGYLSNLDIFLGSYHTQTDDSGYYEFGLIQGGEYELIVNHLPYYEYTQNLIFDSSNLVWNITLDRDPISVYGVVSDQGGSALDGATVTLDTLVEITDASGFYSFDNLAIGEYYFKCSMNGYHLYNDSVELNQSIEKNIALLTPQIDTLWIEEDTYIAYSYYSPDNMSGETLLADINYGQSSLLNLSVHYESYPYTNSGPGWTSAQASRVLLKIPEFDYNSSTIDSVVIELIGSYYAFSLTCKEGMGLHKCLEPWDKDSVTWNSMPTISDEISTYSFYYNAFLEFVRFDVTSLLDNPMITENGVMIINKNEECSVNERITFHSSESSIIGSRPRVLIYR